MTSKKLIIISGITGFIGSSVINQKINDPKYLILGTSSSSYFKFNGNKPHKIKFEEFIGITRNYKEASLIHLATFFSFDSKDDEKILDANYYYGIKLLKKLEKVNLNKIILFNTMFSLGSDKNILNSKYVTSKNNFSKYVKKYSVSNSILFNELYIDNTIGVKDKRKKIVPMIIKSIIDDKENPIQNPEKLINLIDIRMVIDILFEIVQSNKAGSFAIYSNKDYNLTSIYKYIYSNVKRENKDKIIYSVDTSFTGIIPKEINKVPLEYSLEKSLDELITAYKS